MVDTLRERIARWIAPERGRILDKCFAQVDNEVNQRVASVLAKMDPFELVMREYHGVFGEDFEHPEDKLSSQSTLQLRTLGYTLADDPSFNFLCEWIMNSQGNETLIKAPVTVERTLYGRAQISAMLAFRKEVRRLSEAYKDMLAEMRGDSFDSALTAE